VLEANEVLVLNQDTDIILCPDTSCSFDSTSIIQVQATSDGRPVIVTMGGPASPSHPTYGAIYIAANCTVQFTNKGQWHSHSIKLSGGHLQVEGTNVVTTELQMENAQSRITVAGGGKLTTETSTPMSLPGRMDILQGHSSFDAGGDVRFTPSSVVTWIGRAGSSNDVEMFGRLLVDGTTRMSGEARILTDPQSLIPVDADNSEITTFTLISAVDRLSKFKNVILGATLQCADAET
jgi:hypothetical protein